MLKALLRRQLAGFEKTWGYDIAYMRDLLETAGVWTIARFGLVASLGYGKAPPAEAMAAVRVLGTLSGDCGPCTQLVVDMALAKGVAPAVLRAILAGDRAAMGAEAALGYDFARATLDRHLADGDETRSEIVQHWGEKALVDLALALTTAQMYPTLKYGLGHGRTCSKVVVAGVAAPFARTEAVAA